MIGTAIRKYAEAHGMTCDGGYAYGKVNGWHIAMLDSYGVKMLQIYLHPPTRIVDEGMNDRIRSMLEDCDAREYHLIRRNAVNVSADRAVVVFQDGPGAIKRIERYIDEIMPRLDGFALNGDACVCCGECIENEASYLCVDDSILPLHNGCVNRMEERVNVIQSEKKEGSLVLGALGAFLGAALGAIPWAIVYAMGYVAGFAGLIIGFLANFFYGRFRGRNSHARVAVVIAALFFGVILGQAAGASITFARTYEDKGGMDVFGMTRPQYLMTCWDSYFIGDQTLMLSRAYDRKLSNIPGNLRENCMTRSEFTGLEWSDTYSIARLEAVRELLCDMGVGMIFGAIGCFDLFTRNNSRTKSKKPRKLR